MRSCSHTGNAGLWSSGAVSLRRILYAHTGMTEKYRRAALTLTIPLTDTFVRPCSGSARRKM